MMTGQVEAILFPLARKQSKTDSKHSEMTLPNILTGLVPTKVSSQVRTFCMAYI